MSSHLLFDLNDSTDSEDDIDYVPPASGADQLSSDDEEAVLSSDDEMETKTARQKAKKAVEKMCKLLPVTIEKKKSDDIYKSFLEEVAAEEKELHQKEQHTTSGIPSSTITSSPSVSDSGKSSSETSSGGVYEKEYVGCTEEGERVETISADTDETDIDKSIDSLSNVTAVSDSKTGEKLPDATKSAAVAPLMKRKGLESLIGDLKKKKVTTLEKSILDWKSFKEQEGITSELQNFNRGKGGYLERKKFLERSDTRSFEIERDMRLAKKQHTYTKKK